MKWILVTGGSRGIGAGIVLSAAKKGYKVVFTYKERFASANAILNEAMEYNSSCECHSCDSSSEDRIVSLSRDLIAKHGAPYAIVHNAGIVGDELIYKMNANSWREVIAVNLDSLFHLNRIFVPEMMAEGGGRIINISSVAAFRGSVGQSNYAAAKAAVLGLTRSLAVELGRFNICVNAVAPGFIETDMISGVLEKGRRGLISSIPLRRLGKVSDVAELVSFLLSDDASYITGHTFVIDGGLTA